MIRKRHPFGIWNSNYESWSFKGSSLFSHSLVIEYNFSPDKIRIEILACEQCSTALEHNLEPRFKAKAAALNKVASKQARDLSKVLSMPMCSQWTLLNKFNQKYIKHLCLLNFCNRVELDQTTSKCLVCCHFQPKSTLIYVPNHVFIFLNIKVILLFEQNVAIPAIVR